MRFKFFGTEIYISFLFCAVICFMLATDRTGYCLPTLFAALLHECGHLFLMWVFECQPKSIRLVPASISITGSFPRKKYGEFFVSLAGPLVNIFLFVSLYINYKITKSNVSLNFAAINLVIGLFNLLPVKGLDGGTLLFLTLKSRTNDILKCERIVKIVTFSVGTAVTALAIVLIVSGRLNLTALIVGIYILICGLLRE